MNGSQSRVPRRLPRDEPNPSRKKNYAARTLACLLSTPSVGMSADAARKSACATFACACRHQNAKRAPS